MEVLAWFIGVVIVCFYYITVFVEAFGEKYCDNMIGTKKDFWFYMIPFSMWAKALQIKYNELD